MSGNGDDETGDSPFSAGFYWIKCTDGMVPVDSHRIKKLVAEMPVVEYLLLGHPNMKPKALQTNPDDLVPILEIPTHIQLSKTGFVRLVHVVLERIDECEGLELEDADLVNEMYHAVFALGGCAPAEDLLREARRKHRNPMTPTDDVNDVYQWVMTGLSDVNSETMELGYSYVYSEIHDDFNEEHRCCLGHVYRKKRKRPDDDEKTDTPS